MRLKLLVLLCLLVPTIAAGESPTLVWEDLSEGQVRRGAPWNNQDIESNFLKVFFLKGNVHWEGEIDRITVHSLVDGEWQENPFRIHVAPLTAVREDGTRGFSIQIPDESIGSCVDLYVSVIRENEVQHTFPSVSIHQAGKHLTVIKEGCELPPGTILRVMQHGSITPHARTVVNHTILGEPGKTRR